jgi:hypothetical protein
MRRLLFALILWFTGALPGCLQVVYAYDGHFTLTAETVVVKSGSFSVVDWAGYPANLPKITGPVNLIEGAEYTAARRAADVTNNGLREGFGFRGVEMDIHEIQPVKFGGSPTDPLNKMLLPIDLHRQVVTPFWNQLQRDVSPYIYRPPGT